MFYHLERIDEFDLYGHLIIRAKNAKEARRLATKEKTLYKKSDWMDPKIVKCLRIDVDGVSEVVLRAYN